MALAAVLQKSTVFFYTVCNGLVISMLCSMNNYSHIKGNVKYGI